MLAPDFFLKLSLFPETCSADCFQEGRERCEEVPLPDLQPNSKRQTMLAGRLHKSLGDLSQTLAFESGETQTIRRK